MALISSHRGLIRISYRMFVLEPRTAETVDIKTVYGAGMLHAKRHALGVSSAVDSYPSVACLTVEMHNDVPPLEPLSEWDAAAEISYEFTAAAYPNETLNMYPEPLSDDLGAVEITPGKYRIRAYARKQGSTRLNRPERHIEKDPEFDADDTLITSDLLEDCLLQLWLQPFATVSIPQSVELKSHDEYVQW